MTPRKKPDPRNEPSAEIACRGCGKDVMTGPSVFNKTLNGYLCGECDTNPEKNPELPQPEDAPDLEDTVIGVDDPTLREFADTAPGTDDAYKATLEFVPGTVQTQPRTVAIIEADYQHLMNLLGSVESCRSEYNSAKEDANHAKKALETAQSALERALDRIRAGQAAAQEPTLPFDAPAGIPEPSPEGLPYDGIHQSDVAQPEPTFPMGFVTPEMGAEPGEIRRLRVAQTSAWLIERGWKHCDPEHCERYSDDELDKLLAWSRGDTDIPDIDGLTTAE